MHLFLHFLSHQKLQKCVGLIEFLGKIMDLSSIDILCLRNGLLMR